MQETNTVNGSAPRKWGVKVFHVPEASSFELRITLPVGGEDNLAHLLEPSVITALPEIMRALASGRLPGNEIDLAALAKA
jgi:hypothetical protein